MVEKFGYRSRHLAACLAISLVSAGAAYAADGTSPGTLKKDVASGAPTSTAPADTTQGNGKGNAGTNGNVPVTKGTVKKLTTQTGTQTTTDTSEPDTSGTTTTTRRSTRSRVRHSGSTTTRRASSGTRRAAHRGTKSSGAGRTTQSGSGSNAGTSSAAPAAAAPKPAAKPRPRHQTASSSKPKTAAQPKTGFASINRAADRVIEVIPGVVVLALAGLTALVLVLMLRSWLMERRRGLALRQSYGVTVQALATAIEAKDHTTGGHIERVRELGLLLARLLAPRDTRDPQMAYGFLLHDIGKLAIPDAILRAPGRLSEDQWAMMRRHPEEGVRILSSIPFLDRALDVVRHHHERWDGGGYPDGLVGEEIPLWARIFSVVDALDAMTAERPYRHRQPYPVALAEIKRNAGTQFDPAVVAALEAVEEVEVERLLEPAQVLDRVTGSEFADLEPLEAILAATETARVEAGDVAPVQRTAAAA